MIYLLYQFTINYNTINVVVQNAIYLKYHKFIIGRVVVWRNCIIFVENFSNNKQNRRWRTRLSSLQT